MRSEQQMFQLINGSRANKKAAKDSFQDYDIIYIVTDINHYKENKNWIGSGLGQRLSSVQIRHI